MEAMHGSGMAVVNVSSDRCHRNGARVMDNTDDLFIVHWYDPDWQCNVYKAPGQWAYHMVARYAMGLLPPNYPVPAIPQMHEWDYELGLWAIYLSGIDHR
jgi:hypothetical protein